MNAKTLAKKLSFGLADTAVDLVMASVALGLNLAGNSRYHPRDPITILVDSYKLTRTFKRQFLIKTSYYARKKGWLEKKKGSYVLTKSGRDYLAGKIPVYKKHRPWDGRVYLITYDIKEASHWRRDQLRRWLVASGAKMIQQSVWLSVADLTDEMKKFQEKLNENGTILVSSLKKGEGVGREKLNRLIGRLYNLEALNQRYFEFIQLSKNKHLMSEEQSILKFKFLSILAGDPQLPKDLLPFVWYGEEAYGNYTKLMRGRAEI